MSRKDMFNIFKKKKEPRNLKELLFQFNDLEKNFEKIKKEIQGLKKESKFNIQKMGIIRFNPFKEIGGNQSFSIALLDGNNDGIVITSLYTKEGNRVYGKPIKDGQSEFILSEEEKKVILTAKNGTKKSKFNNQAASSGDSGPH